MKIALIQPPSSYLRENYPLGLAFLGAVLEKNGHEVMALDASAKRRPLRVRDIKNSLLKFRPDLIGITIVTPLVKGAYLLAKELKSLGVPIVAGGTHATLIPQEVLKNNFDIVVKGEGEETILDLIKYAKNELELSEIKGISFRDKDGKIVNNPARPYIANLDSIPIPARHLFPLENYSLKSESTVDDYWTILSSRGCPNECIYCSSAQGPFGRKFRSRTPGNIYEEIVSLKKKHNINFLTFYDDTLTVNKSRLIELCGLITKDTSLGIRWDCDSRLDILDDELLSAMKNAGCYHLYFGMESYDAQTLTKIKKGLTQEKIDRGIALVKKHNIDFTLYLIMGWPWENEAHVNRTAGFIRKIDDGRKFFHVFFVPIPYPGTELYDENKSKYDILDWWLRKDSIETFADKDGYIAFFKFNMPYLDHFYLKKNFFRRKRGFLRFLRKTFLDMGKLQLLRYHPKSKAKLIVWLSFMSVILYRINPLAEKTVFRALMSAGPKKLYNKLNFLKG